MKQTFTLLTAAFFMLIAFNSRAQDADSDGDAPAKLKSYISIFGGQSRAYGDFKKTDYSNPKSGFAKNGLVLGIDGAVYFYKHFAIGYTISKQDQGNLTYDDDQKISQGYTDDFKADGSTVTADKRYRSYNILLGPQYTFVYHRFSFDLRASAGIIKNRATPSIAVAIDGVKAQTATFTQESSKGTAFAYGGSAALKFNMGAGWGLLLKGNYIDSKGPNITTTGRTSNLGRIVTKQPMTEGQLVFGLLKEF
ncbi:hypothetical protein SNE25_03610 [Mucilaginibacter sabulilitoris]|uniref:Outer membrane protein beta-barrel domain-containing protein n=1 Tax=Mucilaginibacter sabulilitoris TaxID=1173583 RepID=A0ABZ0TR86_9SPHI|nr:hypothetical protein [Mucilaginibacter sabulilitoris]WPU94608.1 hypothetical protein SNE25_03610 [Mucilaginibacter sabulilitoris]